MFRRPLIGTAIVAGAASVAAKRSVQKETRSEAQREAQYEADVQQEAERRRLEDAEREYRAQKAVDEAVLKTRAENSGNPPIAGPGQPTALSPSPNPYSAQAPVYQMPTAATYSPRPAQFYGPPDNVPPESMLYPPPQNLPGTRGGEDISSVRGSVTSASRFCTKCGYACKLDDNFCSKCGHKQR